MGSEEAGKTGEFAPPIERRREQAELIRRRRRALLVVLGASLVVAVAGLLGRGSDGGTDAGKRASGAPELPRGGRSLLPEYRLVGFYGAPQDPALGALGVGAPPEAAARLQKQIRPYRRGRKVMPVFELLATIAAAAPGEDALYRTRQSHSVIRRYLEEARRSRALLLLDIQPGRAAFLDELKRLRRYLVEPDVGLALDPEWRVGPDQVPGNVIGTVSSAEVNEVGAKLASIVEKNDLPEKLFVIHQFTRDMILQRGRIEARDELATVINIDGFGDAPNKIAKYKELSPPKRSGLASGFKLFYSEDVGLMTPDQVLGLNPTPDLIVYE